MATHIEDLCFMAIEYILSVTGSKTSEPKDVKSNKKDKKNESSSSPAGDRNMIIHHVVTALLCIASYMTTYCKIGSLGK